MKFLNNENPRFYMRVKKFKKTRETRFLGKGTGAKSGYMQKIAEMIWTVVEIYGFFKLPEKMHTFCSNGLAMSNPWSRIT